MAEITEVSLGRSTEKSVKADGGKGPAVAGNTACKESDVLIAVARKRMSARG